MKSIQVQPLSLSNRPKHAGSTTTTIEATTQARDPRWGLSIAAISVVGVFVFLLRPITGNMGGIAIEGAAHRGQRGKAGGK